MNDEAETQETEGEQSWTDSVTEWVEETYEDVTGANDQPADEGPISVPYTEPTEQEQEELRRQSELSDLITSVTNALESAVENVRHQASILSANPSSTSHDECSALAARCEALSGNAYGSAQQLISAGVQDWVYSVKACNEAGFWANSAAGHASAAATADSDTTMGMSLNSCENDLSNALSSVRRA